MDLEIIEKELEDLTQQGQKLIDLVRRLREGKLFDEPLTTTMKANLTNQARTRWLAIKTIYDTTTKEINK